MAIIDAVFDRIGQRPELGRMTEQQLLATEFSASDPENLEGVSQEVQEGTPEIEFGYNVAASGEKVRCVYCKYKNHYEGIVVKYANGVRNLVGIDCAVSKHGVVSREKINEFNAAVEKQSYIRRKRELLSMAAQVYREINDLIKHPAVAVHDGIVRDLRSPYSEFRDVAAGLAAVARRSENLVVDYEVRDLEAEKERKARLGSKFEETRQAAKEKGERWQIFRLESADLGPIVGQVFFMSGVAVRKKLEELQISLRNVFHNMSGNGLTTNQMKIGFRKLAELRDEVSEQYDRLDAVGDVFKSENLARIASWANGQRTAQAWRENRSLAPLSPDSISYASDGRMLIRLAGQRPSSRVGLPNVYHPPRRTLVDTLVRACSFDHEPARSVPID